MPLWLDRLIEIWTKAEGERTTSVNCSEVSWGLRKTGACPLLVRITAPLLASGNQAVGELLIDTNF